MRIVDVPWLDRIEWDWEESAVIGTNFRAPVQYDPTRDISFISLVLHLKHPLRDYQLERDVGIGYETWHVRQDNEFSQILSRIGCSNHELGGTHSVDKDKATIRVSMEIPGKIKSFHGTMLSVLHKLRRKVSTKS